ncbi:bifunctional 2-polyprenyl-6-hydroxyphenol methylase/3-demethylubiquinol 3-O-methyltransferase UbiG [Kitasatospora sp. A2-31]|uniref:class I SAM-dependent methyltransferase n=1 Tax=Kitasatospora sp. A2-31 TaxID=2916414 RepID=UPI001EEE6B46|nr:class I SAM-dependent methyltransferase [Kitasatospora sp. A2-31]MCG6499226.1 class I SAM-dependent methyltransferase [Kitasatospora sp. A2-31]
MIGTDSSTGHAAVPPGPTDRGGKSMEGLSAPGPWDADYREGARFRTVTGQEVDLLAGHLHRPVAGMAVLDVCCGTGELSVALAERGAAVTGVDFAPSAITAARERCAHLPGTVFRELDVNHALDELPDRRFDLVAFRLALAFLDQPAVLAAARRRLAPGGVIAVTTPLAERQSDGRHHIGLDHAALERLRTGWREVTEYPLGSLLCLLLRP